MYFSYVVNCKFVSHNSVPAVNFMRKCLTEMFGLNESVTYNHAFMYIRQLAIHLKSAVTLKKKVCLLIWFIIFNGVCYFELNNKKKKKKC